MRKLFNVTPVSVVGLVKYDDRDPAEAIVYAWTKPGVNPEWHSRQVEYVRESMPLLARAIDRLVEENS